MVTGCEEGHFVGITDYYVIHDNILSMQQKY